MYIKNDYFGKNETKTLIVKFTFCISSSLDLYSSNLETNSSAEMQSRNDISNNQGRHITTIPNEDLDVSNAQLETQIDSIPLTSMHSHSYLNYQPSHSQMVGMPQMIAAHGIENHFQVKFVFRNLCFG